MFQKKSKLEIQIVELENRKELHPLDKETLTSLEHHPAFQHILELLRLEAAALKSKLASDTHPNIRAVDNLQLGIRWCQWLESKLRLLTSRAPGGKPPVNATESELREFQNILDNLKLIGQ